MYMRQKLDKSFNENSLVIAIYPPPPSIVTQWAVPSALTFLLFALSQWTKSIITLKWNDFCAAYNEIQQKTAPQETRHDKRIEKIRLCIWWLISSYNACECYLLKMYCVKMPSTNCSCIIEWHEDFWWTGTISLIYSGMRKCSAPIANPPMPRPIKNTK